MKNEEYIDINKIAELKGLKSNRSLRLAIQKGLSVGHTCPTINFVLISIYELS